MLETIIWGDRKKTRLEKKSSKLKSHSQKKWKGKIFIEKIVLQLQLVCMKSEKRAIKFEKKLFFSWKECEKF